MGKKYDVTALGELLIDFTSSGLSEQGNPLFEANPGGAPCNVLAMLNRLGKKTNFIGKVGEDQFGKTLKSTWIQRCTRLWLWFIPLRMETGIFRSTASLEQI